MPESTTARVELGVGIAARVGNTGTGICRKRTFSNEAGPDDQLSRDEFVRLRKAFRSFDDLDGLRP